MTESIGGEASLESETPPAWLGSPLTIRGIALWGVLAAVCGLSAEVAVRLDDFIRQKVPLKAVPNLRRDLMLFDSLGQRGRPNGRFQRWELNSAGFRSPESVLTRRPGCIQVMTIGTSETFGAAGEREGKEYPAQLADSLAGRGCYQVMNAAIVGQTLPEQIHFWNAWASKFDPDIVVILGSPNNYLLETEPRFHSPSDYREPGAKPWWTPRLLGKALDLFAFPAVINHWRVERRLKAATHGRPPGWMFDSIPADRLSGFRRDLDSMISAVRTTGARPVLATYPNRFGSHLRPEDKYILAAWHQFTPRAQPEVMLDFAAAGARVVREIGECQGIPVADLYGAMDGKGELFFDFVHYTDAGAGVVAGTVAAAVLRATTDSIPGSQPRACETVPATQ